MIPNRNVDKKAGGIQIADERGVILFTDEVFDSLFGYERGELVGKPVSLLHAHPGEENPQKMKKIFEPPETEGQEVADLFNRKKNGSPISTRSRIFPLPLSGQKLWLAVVEDAGKEEPAWGTFERLAMNISTEFARLELHEIEKGIIDALKMFGEFLQAGHCFLCLLYEKSGKIEKIYEWRTPGVAPKFFPLVGCSLDFLPWQSNLQPDLRKNPLFASETQQGRSDSGRDAGPKEEQPVLLIPIFYGKSSVAILGFAGLEDEKRWPEETIANLRMAGEILINTWERKRVEEDLQETRRKYRSLVENMNDAIFSLDQQGCFTYISPVVERLILFKPEDLLGQPLARFVYPEDLPDFTQSLQRNLLHSIESFEFRILDQKGNIRHLRASSRPQIAGGQPVGLTGILSDITDHKWAEVLLKRTEERYRGLFENAVEGIFQSTEEGQIIIANSSCARILGYASPEDLTAQGEKSKRLFFADPAKYDEFQRLLADHGAVQKYEVQVFRQDGSTIWISLNALAIRSPSGVPLFYEGRMEDITERKWSEDRIHHLSFHDKLTSLYNRSYFEEEFKRLDTDRQLPISVIMGDVNCLKLVNDAFGHEEGDKFLKQIALIIRDSCRKEDVVARVGGDEFAIFLPRTGAKVTSEIVKRIRCFCRQKSIGSVHLSVALGVGIKETACQDFQGVLRDAEERMYRNKLLENKKIRVSFISSLQRILFAKSYKMEERSRRIKKLALRFGRRLKVSEGILDELALLATWHDIGKVAIPEEVLRKPGSLTPEDEKWIRKHPEIGYRIAESSNEFASIAEAILAHHERWDGSGYPLELKGENIPFISRIVSIVDAYVGMTHGHPHQKAQDGQVALEEIKRGAGTQFDPALVEAFVRMAT